MDNDMTMRERSGSGSDGPLVSVGLPVRNGGEYLNESIRSILAQTYRNIELVICDNLSTDDTQQICEAFAAEDPRVRYHRNEQNFGGAVNHNLVFQKSVGEYFRWSAHDDLVEPMLIERCVEILESRPEIVLCHSDVTHIDGEGEITGHVSRNHCSAERPSQRMSTIVLARDSLEEVYGLVRSEVLARTKLMGNYTSADRTLMGEVALQGRFFNIEEPLFRKRLHDGNVYVDWRTRMLWFSEDYRGRPVFPWWMQMADLLRVIRRVPLASGERWRCYGCFARWVAVNSKRLLKDLAVAVITVTRSAGSREQRAASTENWA